MIAKPYEEPEPVVDPVRRAGAEAERQMAFYLHRAFAASESLYVLNDLRLVDDAQPEHDGRAGVCQIDHLVLHRHGVFVVESKSVTDEVSVRDDGTGGDEWTRRFRGREQGFASPIQQARRQGEFLRAFLQRRREAMLGKQPIGLRTISKLTLGTDQRGFTRLPVQIVVAVSDRGKIRRVNRWREPSEPFQTFVSKADLVADKIREQVGLHRDASRVRGEPNGGYGVWAMRGEEVPVVASFLMSHHQPRGAASPVVPAAAPPVVDEHKPVSRPASAGGPSGRKAVVSPKARAAVPPGPACKGCGATDLHARWGRYGYYWACLACGVNTAMPTVCSVCGRDGKRGGGVRIRKDGPKYYRTCAHCEIEERLWTEPDGDGS